MKNGRPLAQKNGNDKVMTPISLASKIVLHFQPTGKILEPCAGSGNFLRIMPTADFCEIDDGIDFMDVSGHWDWVVTNPPYSKYRDFMNKSFEVADNVVFLQLINATWYKARLRDMKNAGFGIKEILLLDTPKEFPQFGFQLGCVYYKKGYNGAITISTGV